LGIPAIKTEWHRYAVDLNRDPEQVDADSVEGHKNPSGKYPCGFHWSRNTASIRLIPKPMSLELHQLLVAKYQGPFDRSVKEQIRKIKESGSRRAFHLDLHSMSSVGGPRQKDEGQPRASVIISDGGGKTCSADFLQLTINAYEGNGFKVAINNPFIGGAIVHRYGQPKSDQESIQVELNRGIYMDEVTKELRLERLQKVQERLTLVLTTIQHGVGKL
jgi:N-formylglutamate amidohydrolase